MKTSYVFPRLVAAVVGSVLFSTSAVLANTIPPDFTGVFSGFYAPSGWTTAMSGNQNYVAAPVVVTDDAPSALLFIGAIGNGTTPGQPSMLDYSIQLPGAGPISVSFSYAFFNPAGSGDVAQVMDNGTVIANLNAADSQFVMASQFSGGDTLGIRLVSDVVNLPDVLEIAPIPEPSTIALAGLSTAAFLLQLRRRSAKR